MWDADNGWLISRLGKRDRRWGRLIVEAPEPPTERLIAVTERAAAALAMHRLHDRHRDSVVRRNHHELIVGLMTDPTDPDVLRRCELAGVPVEKRQFVGLTLRPTVDGFAGSRPSSLEDVVAATVHAASELRAPALVCELDHDVRVLLSLPPSTNPSRVTEELAKRVLRRHTLVICAGRSVTRSSEIDRTLREAHHVARSVRGPGEAGRIHRLEDVHLRGLLTLLGDDDRVSMFVDRELASLKRQDELTGAGLLDALRALVEHPSSKSDAAASLHVSRPVFYDRLAKIERVLGVDLDDPDVRVSLHVALVADEVLGG